MIPGTVAVNAVAVDVASTLPYGIELARKSYTLSFGSVIFVIVAITPPYETVTVPDVPLKLADVGTSILPFDSLT